MKIKTDEKGITIGVLVITVIVLLILAGTSITIGLNNGGVLPTALNETTKQNETKENITKDMDSVMRNQEKEWGIE